MHYLFDEVELGKMLRVHIRSPTKRHQVPRGADPQKPQWDPDQHRLLQTQREVWVFSVQIRCILRTTHTQTDTHTSYLYEEFPVTSINFPFFLYSLTLHSFHTSLLILSLHPKIPQNVLALLIKNLHRSSQCHVYKNTHTKQSLDVMLPC